MNKPIVADNKSIKVNLKEGRHYSFCTCGRSKSQPFCDGSHKGTGFTPLRFFAEREQVVGLCQCKQTKSPPFCDGSHKKVPNEYVGKNFNEC